MSFSPLDPHACARRANFSDAARLPPRLSNLPEAAPVAPPLSNLPAFESEQAAMGVPVAAIAVAASDGASLLPSLSHLLNAAIESVPSPDAI